jgi:hypothetical protein
MDAGEKFDIAKTKKDEGDKAFKDGKFKEGSLFDCYVRL